MLSLQKFIKFLVADSQQKKKKIPKMLIKGRMISSARDRAKKKKTMDKQVINDFQFFQLHLCNMYMFWMLLFPFN
jgi:hypothetical protein